MKKTAFIIISLLLILGLAACGSSGGNGGNGGGQPKDPAEPYYGTYKLAGLVSVDGSYSQDILDSTFAQFGEDYFIIEWTKDKVVLTMDGETYETGCAIDFENKTLTDGYDTFDLEIKDDGTLIMDPGEYGDIGFVLKKVQ